MKNDQTTTKKTQRPPRVQLTKEEVVDRMKKFSEREYRFLSNERQNT